MIIDRRVLIGLMILPLLATSLLHVLPFAEPIAAHGSNTDAWCCPWPTESKYIRATNGNLPTTASMEYWGAQQGAKSSNTSYPWYSYNRDNARPYFGVVILAFGVQIQAPGGDYGTRVTGGSHVFASENYIHDAVVAFARGFYNNTPPTYQDPPKLRILVGTSNYTDWPYGALAPSVGGSRWGALVSRIGSTVAGNNWNSKITISGATDIEPGWSNFSWVDTWTAYYAATSNHAYYNFGSADACYPDPPQNGFFCANGWTQENVWYVSRGAPKVRGAIPQIYYEYPLNGGTQHFMAKQWQRISLQGYIGTNHPGQKVDFSGESTTWNMCPAGRTCRTPQQGWKDLMYHLNNHDPSYHGTTPSQDWCTEPVSSCHRTDQSGMAWSTDWVVIAP